MKLLDSNEIRQLRDVCIFEVNGFTSIFIIFDFLDSIKESPLQGVEIAKNIRKIRMAIGSKGKGKSGGARIITFNVLTDIQNGHVFSSLSTTRRKILLSE